MKPSNLLASIARRWLLPAYLFMVLSALPLSIGAEPTIVRSPGIFAHRGGLKWAPENTLAAFKQSIATGCDGIAIEVQRCKTGELVVISDETLGRTTNGAGPVAEKSLDEIRSLDAGSWFGRPFKGEKIPTLGEVLVLVNGRLVVDIEVRNAPSASPGIEEAVMDALRQYQHLDKIVVSSFDHELLHRLHERAPQYKIALLTKCIPYNLVSYASSVGAKCWNANVAELRDDSVKSAHKAGLAVTVWTVNEPKTWQRVADMGVDNIITDDPIGLIEYLKVRTTASAY